MAKIYTVPDDIEMIAGDSVLIPYDVQRDDGGYVDFTLDGSNVEWFLSLWNDPDQLILKKSIADDGGISVDSVSPNIFVVALTSEDTSALAGPFLYQIEITIPSGEKLRKIQGSITIVPRIATTI